MARLPRVTAKQMSLVLERLGFARVRQSGSHAIYRNDHGLRATVPMHTGAVLHPKTIKTILKDAGISADQLRKMI